MNIQTLEHADLISLAEFQPAGWPDILPHFSFYTISKICFPIKVIIDNKIAGIGTTIIHNETAWLAHIIVHPTQRNKGIGLAITKTLVDSLKAINCESIYLIATDLGMPVYKKVGFKTETEYLFFKDVKINQKSTTSINITSFNQKYREQIIDIDRQISGENRFIQLQEHLNDSSIYRVKNKVEGYYLPTWGEGLIIAKNPSAGIELMKLRLKKNNFIALPIDNEDGIEFLLNNNFREFKRAKRMRLGKKRTWEPTNIYNRISGSIG